MSSDLHNLDIPSLTAILQRELPNFDGEISAQKFADGQSNPTYLLTTRRKRLVLRRKPPGVLLKSAHAVEREYKVQKALSGTDVPVAAMHILCEDPEIIGSPFYVMDFVPGRIFFDPALPDVDKTERAQIIKQMCRTLAAIHSIDLSAAGLSDYGPPGNYVARQISRWSKQYYASETEKLLEMDKLISALEEHIKSQNVSEERTLVHGDYRIDNIIYSQNEPQILAVLDWELSTIGHPIADLASVIMQWRMPKGTTGRGLDGIDRNELGLLSDEEFIATYCEHRNLPKVDDFGFYLAFCFFRMAAILQGVKKRALEGNASNPEHGLKMGKAIPTLVAKGLKALEND